MRIDGDNPVYIENLMIQQIREMQEQCPEAVDMEQALAPTQSICIKATVGRHGCYQKWVEEVETYDGSLCWWPLFTQETRSKVICWEQPGGKLQARDCWNLGTKQPTSLGKDT